MTEDIKRIKGKITKISEKGFGFIISPDIPFTKFFFHWSALSHKTKKFTDLKTGMKVEFTPLMEPVPGESKGPRAVKIIIIED